MTTSSISIPEDGRNKGDVLKEMISFRKDDADFRSAKTWSLVYYLNDEHTEFLKQAYGTYFSENGLNPMAFKSLKRFESEVVRMTANMLHGDGDVVGTITSGGTESCMLSVKTYRDRAREKKPWILRPNMVVPESVHVAFEKAAEYFDVKVLRAPLGKDYRVNVKAVKRLVNHNTIMIVGSAPAYPHGVVDDIEALGRIAQKKHIPLHVDSCLGGFMLPFVEKLGYRVPVFDFRVPGVTSMSADVHKYGFAAKGASTVLYRNIDYLKNQFFIFENWPGGIFISPALLGTRPGGAIAAAWAAMQAIGINGYTEQARQAMDVTKKLIDGVNAIEPLRVIGKPHMTVFAYESTSPDINIYAVGDRMEERGWHIDRQQKPESLHAMVTPKHAAIADQYLEDLRASVQEVRANPELANTGGAAMYGMIAHIPMRGMIKKQVLNMMMDMYSPEGKMIDPGARNDDLATKAGMMYLKFKRELLKKLDGLR